MTAIPRLNRISPLLIWTCGMCVASTVPRGAQAQRRGEQGAQAAELNIELQMAVRFGEVTVPPHVYRVQVSNDNLVLANPDTMEVAATLPATAADLSEAAAAKADVQVKGNDVQLVVTMGDHSYTVRGQKTSVPATAVESEAPEQKAEREVGDGGGDTEPKSPAAQVSQATQRYLPALANCIDGAQKAHWITDDPRFSNCVCPVALKWQMPKLQAPLRMHQKLVKGKFGMSFTVTSDGRVKDCRVWSGARAPEMTPKPAAAPASPSVAPVVPAP